jgi:hypothetical protein
MQAFSDITVAASEVAPVCDLEFEITERRDRGRIQRRLSLKRRFRKSDQIFRETELDEFLVLLSSRRIFALADFNQELVGIGVQFIKFIAFDVIEVGFFEIFQNGVRGQNEEFILGGHRKSLQG